MSRLLQALKNLEAKAPPPPAAEPALAVTAPLTPLSPKIAALAPTLPRDSLRQLETIRSHLANLQADVVAGKNVSPPAPIAESSQADSPREVIEPWVTGKMPVPSGMGVPPMAAKEIPQAAAPQEEPAPVAAPSPKQSTTSPLEKLIRERQTSAELAEPFRELADRLERDAAATLSRCLLFTGIGAASVSDELLAQVGSLLAERAPIVLVDADFSRTRLSAGFGVSDSPVGAPVAESWSPWKSSPEATTIPGLFLLRADISLAAEPGSLHSAAAQQMARVLERLENSYQLVLVDGGESSGLWLPLLGRLCDAAYLVIRLGATDAYAAEQALQRLRGEGVRVLGCIATGGELP